MASYNKVNPSLLFIFMTVTTGISSCPIRCTCRGTEVSCRGKGLTLIPYAIPQNTTHLDLHGNRISRVRQASLRGLHRLQHLDLSNNEIIQIDPASLKDLRNLRTLHMYNNHITMITHRTTHGVRTLTEVNLNNNPIKWFGMYTFDYRVFKRLRMISMYQNDISCTCDLLVKFERLAMRNVVVNATCNLNYKMNKMNALLKNQVCRFTIKLSYASYILPTIILLIICCCCYGWCRECNCSALSCFESGSFTNACFRNIRNRRCPTFCPIFLHNFYFRLTEFFHRRFQSESQVSSPPPARSQGMGSTVTLTGGGSANEFDVMSSIPPAYDSLPDVQDGPPSYDSIFPTEPSNEVVTSNPVYSSNEGLPPSYEEAV